MTWVCDLVLGGVYGGEVLIFEVMDGAGSDFVCLFFFFFWHDELRFVEIVVIGGCNCGC